MDQQVKKDWIAGLRSGKYQQGFGRLKTRNQDGTYCHCAIGVLVEIYHEQTGNGEWEENDVTSSMYFKLGNGIDACSPLRNVIEWAGLTGADPLVTFKSSRPLTVMTMNDENGYDFDRIANEIEASNEL